MPLYSILVTLLLFVAQFCWAQGLHFSQNFNAPLLLSPANTGLMPNADYRIGAHYRSQWESVPVPFKTISAFGDFKIPSQNNNWLAVGAAFFNDKSGSGALSLNKLHLSAAYHVHLNDEHMLSAGIGAAYVQRSIDYSNLTFDMQWDGFTFNRENNNGEPFQTRSTQYFDLMAGINYAYAPSEDLYAKIGIGAMHINQPKESFYQKDYKIGIRPTANVDVLFKVGKQWIINPSFYISYQKGAMEMVVGSMYTARVSSEESRSSTPTLLIMGTYFRLGDALVPMVGLEWNNIRLVASADITISSLNKYAGANGGFEVSLMFLGIYDGMRGRISKAGSYNCPRF